ncbi:MAG: nucleoside-diphosphate sugar epimerase/dehydratase, partial [Aquificaceae bacterium]
MDKWFKDASFFLVLMASDLISYYVSLTLSYFTRLMLNPILKEEFVFTFPLLHFLSMWWMTLVFIFFLFYEGLYTKRYTFPEDLRRLFKIVFLSIASVFFLVGITKKSEEVSRLMILMLGIYMYPVITFLRYLSKKLLFKWGFGVKRFIVIGIDGIVQKAASFLDSERMLGYRLMGFFSDRDTFKRLSVNGRSFVVRRLKSVD